MSTTLSGNVLIIDDEASLRQTFAQILRQAGCQVTVAADGPEGLRRLAAASYDLVYLDIRLPDMDGLQVLKEIHRLYTSLPVILFTAHASLQSALDAIRLGAADYLLKPLKPALLIARTQSILADQAVQQRRRQIQEQIAALQAELKAMESPSPTASQPQTTVSTSRFLSCGRLELDLLAQRVTLGGSPLSLSPTGFDYLAALVRHAPEAISYQTLVAEAQGYQTDIHQARELCRWHIHTLREALEPNPNRPTYILNVRGTGYRLVAG
jgi:DNA-binding response OmpR family regulator